MYSPLRLGLYPCPFTVKDLVSPIPDGLFRMGLSIKVISHLTCCFEMGYDRVIYFINENYLFFPPGPQKIPSNFTEFHATEFHATLFHATEFHATEFHATLSQVSGSSPVQSS